MDLTFIATVLSVHPMFSYVTLGVAGNFAIGFYACIIADGKVVCQGITRGKINDALIALNEECRKWLEGTADGTLANPQGVKL